MLFDDKRRALRRALAGALLGMAGGGLAAWAAGSLIAGSPSALALAFLNCGFPRGLEGVGLPCPRSLRPVRAEVGVATLPFAGDGSALVGRTLAHFALTAATVGLWVGLNFGVRETAAFLVPLALVYLLVWLGRWVGWYAEVSAIRERLGLAPGPSLFRLAGDPALCPLRRPAVSASALCAAAVRRRRRAGALRPALPLPPAARRRLLFRPVPGEAAGLLPPSIPWRARGSCFASPCWQGWCPMWPTPTCSPSPFSPPWRAA